MERRKRSIPLCVLVQSDENSDESDSDFRAEDYSENDITTDFESEINSDEDSKSDNENTASEKENLQATPLSTQKTDYNIKIDLSKIVICGVCLGDETSDYNEIVECDSCGVTVHEDCCGISDTDSVSSSGSGKSKASWFCDACQAGKENPTCELCPNPGGIFKETDTGLWVHLVCALYMPGVAFREVTNLRGVTLFDMSYKKWGERVCSLCPDQQLSQTGVCIECDAGLCRTFFHATCAQKEGLLSEAKSEEINHADPFYAHCKLHSDKSISKVRKRNWLAYESKIKNHKKLLPSEESDPSNLSKSTWVKTELQKHQRKYIEKSTIYKHQPWVKPHKMSRPLISSASTLEALNRKATLSGIDTQAWALKEALAKALADIHRKWHVAPAFDFEFVGYYLDRNSRIISMKQNLNVQIEENAKLLKEQQELQKLFNTTVERHQAAVINGQKLKSIMKIHNDIFSKFERSKILPDCYNCIRNSPNCSSLNSARDAFSLQEQTMNSVTNEGTGFVPKSLSLLCCVCKLSTDQHLLIKCDACLLYYHLNCLNPPLARMPKKTKVMGWQCSECDKSSSDSDPDEVDMDARRKMRHLKVLESSYFKACKAAIMKDTKKIPEKQMLDSAKKAPRKKNGKKRKRSHSFNSSRNSNLQKVKRQRVTTNNLIATLNTSHKVVDVSSSETMIKETEVEVDSNSNSVTLPGLSKAKVKTELQIMCNNCQQMGTKANIVTCDDCMKSYHFLCLNPPVKKSPKGRGYSWHCTECDPTESD
ncbi:PHD finger protein 14 [Macrosteles quadrilineatus]|uniref:PHD finger protein 14 n=1 Tax=Macrosteles quadrilineatus TaxID=74068 RepID=UPI0023E25420|nr:PHD finger protein 14 [Macrosteles quadrilineatus]XP_054264805.1 PHD finger protein 14 [Macrosteles quadrilineatus]